jgi:Tannase and feruloyl esterase
VVSTDAGHELELLDVSRTLTHFGVNPRDRTDYAYRAVGVVTLAAKRLIQEFYGSAPGHSFFVGCSNGGRQAMMAATRYGREFDGVLAGAPPLHMSGALLQAPSAARSLAAIAPGSPSDSFSSDELDEVSRRIVARCDGLDGAADGFVLDPLACDQNITAYTAWCGIWPGSCLGLSPSRFAALEGMLRGPRATNGTLLYPSLTWDPGINAGSFRNWRIGSPLLPSFFELLGASGIPEIASVPPALQCADGLYTMGADGRFWKGSATKTPAQCTPSRARSWEYLKTVDIDQAYAAMNTVWNELGFPKSGRQELDVPSPSELAEFKAGGGKLVMYSGTADALVAYRDLTAYWDELRRVDTRADDFAAFYPVPGMSHCGGGRAADAFDLFNLLENWVKRGTSTPPPWEVSAQTRPSANAGDLDELAPGTRTLPLCRYPQRALWDRKAQRLMCKP